MAVITWRLAQLFPLTFVAQVENCAITISSCEVGAVLQQKEEGRDAVEDFPALGRGGGVKKERGAKAAEKRSPAPAAAPAASNGNYSQVTVLLDASGWSLKMASLDAFR